MISNKLIIDNLIEFDDTGMPQAPGVRQLIDRDIKELWRRDRTATKKRYIAECTVIYYLGDPKSPARQAGLSEPEALRMAIEQAGLNNDYIPDALVLNLIKKYYQHNLSVSAINSILNEKLNGSITLEDLPNILAMVDNVNKKAGELPSILKKLNEAKQNLMYEKETELTRGGNVLLSSMDSEDY